MALRCRSRGRRPARDGTYSIDGLEAGAYNACFIPGARPGHVAGRHGHRLGRPVASRHLRFAWIPQSGGWLRQAHATTSASGSYQLLGLSAGVVNKVVFSPLSAFEGQCEGGIGHAGFVSQWFDRKINLDAATGVIAARGETRAGVDGLLGPSAIPPAGAVRRARKCVVPRLRNRTFGFARAALAAAGCSTPRPTLNASSRLKRGRVIETRPAARSRLSRGRPVRLIVSRGR